MAQNAHDGLEGFDPLVRAQPRLKRRLWRLRRKLDHILDGKAPESAAAQPIAELSSLLVEASKLVEAAGEAAAGAELGAD